MVEAIMVYEICDKVFSKNNKRFWNLGKKIAYEIDAALSEAGIPLYKQPSDDVPGYLDGEEKLLAYDRVLALLKGSFEIGAYFEKTPPDGTTIAKDDDWEH